MKLAILYSTGKDSTYAMYLAEKKHEISCLISIESENPESYMFHTPNISLATLGAKALEKPLILKKTSGVKEEELSDLFDAIQDAKNQYGIEGVVTGANESVYQATRVQKICNELNLWCFNPLWKMKPDKLVSATLDAGLKTMITGVFAYPLDESWLGKIIDKKILDELNMLNEKYSISQSGEGGEIETTVLDAPNFSKKIDVVKYEIEYRNNSGIYKILDAKLIEK